VPLTFPKFPNLDNNGGKIKGELDITLCLIYRPVYNKEIENFNITLSLILMQNRNKKGTSLINLMVSLNMKITNSFFSPRPSTLDATTMHTHGRTPVHQNPYTCFTCSHAQIPLSTEYNDATPQNKEQKVITWRDTKNPHQQTSLQKERQETHNHKRLGKKS
jgi:hypothetical protein